MKTFSQLYETVTRFSLGRELVYAISSQESVTKPSKKEMKRLSQKFGISEKEIRAALDCYHYGDDVVCGKEVKFKKKMNEELQAVSLKGIKWNTERGTAFFMTSSPGYGIMNDKGQMLSHDGEQPVSFRTKKITVQQLPYANDFKNHVWIDVIRK